MPNTDLEDLIARIHEARAKGPAWKLVAVKLYNRAYGVAFRAGDTTLAEKLLAERDAYCS